MDEPTAGETRVARAVADLSDAGVRGGIAGAFDDAVGALVIERIGNDAWTGLTQSWDPTQCRLLARIARGVKDLPSRAAAAVATTVTTAAWRLTAQRSAVDHTLSLLAGELAYRAVQLALPYSAVLFQTATWLRATGICLCLQENVIEQCQCLEDLLRDGLIGYLRDNVPGYVRLELDRVRREG